jgi:acetolactate synthase-1/2/3 large subunit
MAGTLRAAESLEATSLVRGGDAVVRILEAFGVQTAFGVISIHNMPMLDAIARRKTIGFVPARGEAGATNMADGYARSSGKLGVVFTSTGPGAGNAAGAMTEALTAGTPLLHLTGQIDNVDVDCGRAMNHETADQLAMLKAVSKAAFRVRSSSELVRVVTQAIRCALSPPTGPVSIEIPIDIQLADAPFPRHIPTELPPPLPLDGAGVAAALELIVNAKRPVLWIGAGAHDAGAAVKQLADRGVAVVSSVHGRGILPDSHPMMIGALNNSAAAEAFYGTCDVLIAAGTKLRANETKKHMIRMPAAIVQIDNDVQAWNRNYTADVFVLSDAAVALTYIADNLPASWTPDPALAADTAKARRDAEADMRASIGVYGTLCDVLAATVPRDTILVCDVTISANTWGNRLFPVSGWRNAMCALGGGIGQGMQQGIGATYGADGRRVVALCGDGGLAVNIGELMTAVQENVDLLLIVMNDGGYGVIKNIQHAAYGGREAYWKLFLPDLQKYAALLGMPAWRAGTVAEFQSALTAALAVTGPRIVEVDMKQFGDFPVSFAGPKLK